MKKALLPVLVGVALVTAASPAQALPRFSAYVACTGSVAASHACTPAHPPYSRFVDRIFRLTPYRRCIRTPGGKTFCSLNRTGVAGLVHQRAIPFRTLGTYTVTFVSRGVLIRSWTFALRR